MMPSFAFSDRVLTERPLERGTRAVEMAYLG